MQLQMKMSSRTPHIASHIYPAAQLPESLSIPSNREPHIASHIYPAAQLPESLRLPSNSDKKSTYAPQLGYQSR